LSEPVKLPTLASSASVHFGGDDSKWLFIPQDETLNVLNTSDLSAEPLVFEGALVQPIQDRWLLTSTLENDVSLWDISKPVSPVVQTFDYGISESQNWFYYFDDEYTLWLLDLKSANPKPMKVRQYEGEYYYYPTISADDHWLAIASDDGTSTLVYDLTQNLAKSELSDVTPFNFSPDGHWLALQDAKQNMVIYDLQAHKQLPVTYPNSYGFQEISPDGRWAVGELDSSANAGMLLIDLNNPEKFYVLTGHTDQVNGRLFTPDQRWLLTYSWDGTVRIWNLENPADDPVILSHENLVSNVQLLKNGKWLVSATGENVYIWQWDFNAVHDLACRLVGRNLTPIEWDKYIGGEYQKTCEQWP
jgi:WD40 repeat protein